MKNKIITSIHQPDFFPYFGYFNKINKSDVYIVMDNVQLSKSGWTHRDKIKTSKEVSWITIPIKNIKKKQLIKDCLIDHDINWKKKHINMISESYKNSKFINEGIEIINDLYKLNTNYLFEFNFNIINKLFEIFKINVDIKLLSQLNVDGDKSELLIKILKKINSNLYLSGDGAKNFIDIDLFKNNNIEIIFNDFKHPIYEQIHGNFVKDLSILDIILNCGITETEKLIKNA
ncbi:WbqC family protein [Candidatus Pelagibacter sp.]|nr:WbqC family protein [Candidatus Pelagibacter sp.]